MANKQKVQGGFACCHFIVALLFTLAYAWLAFKNEEYVGADGKPNLLKCCAVDNKAVPKYN